MLIYKENSTKYTIGVWKISETINALLSLLNRNEAEILQNSNIGESRLLEKAATRLLLNELTHKEVQIAYNSNGKPYLINYCENISISHTKGYAAIILSKSAHIGIDIEYISDRVERIRSRFISNNEYINPDCSVIHLLLHWSAKETIYKALSMEGIDLRKDFHIEKFEPQQSGIFTAHEYFSKDNLDFRIQYFISDDYVLTYTI